MTPQDEHLEIGDYKMGVGGELMMEILVGEREMYHPIREQLYAQMMGWA